MENTAIAYTRVSTPDQGANGISLSIQKEVIGFYAKRAGLQVIDHFEDVASGTGDGFITRQAFVAAVQRARQTGSVLIVQDVSRLTRDEGTYAALSIRGIKVHSAMHGGPLNRVAGLIEARHAELHGEAISERTKNALVEKKGTGALGNPSNLDEARKEGVESGIRKADDFACQMKPIVTMISEELEANGQPATPRAIADALNAGGVATRRGGRWAYQSVKNLILRQSNLEEIERQKLLATIDDYGAW